MEQQGRDMEQPERGKTPPRLAGHPKKSQQGEEGWIAL